jgi:hypothetical protein
VYTLNVDACAEVLLISMTWRERSPGFRVSSKRGGEMAAANSWARAVRASSDARIANAVVNEILEFVMRSVHVNLEMEVQ